MKVALFLQVIQIGIKFAHFTSLYFLYCILKMFEKLFSFTKFKTLSQLW